MEHHHGKYYIFENFGQFIIRVASLRRTFMFELKLGWTKLYGGDGRGSWTYLKS